MATRTRAAPVTEIEANMVEPAAFIHAIGTAVPKSDIHRIHVDWAAAQLADERQRNLFSRMAERSGIEHRWSVLPYAGPGASPVDPGGFYDTRNFPSTGQRMQVYAREAPDLAIAAIQGLATKVPLSDVTHLVVASCTGFMAPGVDQVIAARLGLPPGVERTLIGFMGCYAAVSALRQADHIARANAGARILVVTVELCSLHLVASDDMKALLAGMQFGDGAAAALVSSEPDGLRLERFLSVTLPDSADLIQWTIGDTGFEMFLSGEVPHRIQQCLADPVIRGSLVGDDDAAALAWAVHPGGKSVLDAVEQALELAPEQLSPSRSVLDRFGNMSSSTLLFVLAELLDGPGWERGVAMAFGPGMVAETFTFARA